MSDNDDFKEVPRQLRGIDLAHKQFKDYLNNYRIEQACQLLLRTDKKIYQIAEMVGYHDLDYFVNRFISTKGCTPAKFRKQAKTRAERKE